MQSLPPKCFCSNTFFLGTIYDSSKCKALKMVELKNERNFSNKKPAAIPTLCKRNFFCMHHIDFIHTLLSVPSLPLGMICSMGVGAQVWARRMGTDTNMDNINMVHPRKFSLAESWDSSMFFISKISFIFHFNHF